MKKIFLLFLLTLSQVHSGVTKGGTLTSACTSQGYLYATTGVTSAGTCTQACGQFYYYDPAKMNCYNDSIATKPKSLTKSNFVVTSTNCTVTTLPSMNKDECFKLYKKICRTSPSGCSTVKNTFTPGTLSN
jgi:hypothetical protein